MSYCIITLDKFRIENIGLSDNAIDLYSRSTPFLSRLNNRLS